jgi:predicted transposase/invertase (TIGR01784 family)
LETRFEKWLYVIRNLSRLDRIPDRLRERIFERVFETAEVACFTVDQMQTYEDSLKAYRDLKNSLDTAREEGEALGGQKGLQQGIEQVARRMLAAGMPPANVAALTGLSAEQVARLSAPTALM